MRCILTKDCAKCVTEAVLSDSDGDSQDQDAYANFQIQAMVTGNSENDGDSEDQGQDVCASP